LEFLVGEATQSQMLLEEGGTQIHFPSLMPGLGYLKNISHSSNRF